LDVTGSEYEDRRENYIKRELQLCIVHQMALKNVGGLKGRIVAGIRGVLINVGNPD
jgi:hypothetical protein